MPSKLYVIIACFFVVISFITISYVYVIKSERKIKELQQENLIYKANEEQTKIELENNKNIILSLNKQIKKTKEIEIKKQQQLKQESEQIAKLSTQEQIETINVIFENL